MLACIEAALNEIAHGMVAEAAIAAHEDGRHGDRLQGQGIRMGKDFVALEDALRRTSATATETRALAARAVSQAGVTRASDSPAAPDAESRRASGEAAQGVSVSRRGTARKNTTDAREEAMTATPNTGGTA